MKSKIIRLIKRDLKVGFQNSKYKFLGVFLIFFVITWLNSINIKSEALELGLSSKDINFIDLFFITFKGSDYNISPLPIVWILINIYITYLIGSYCYDDLSNDSAHILVRMKNRKWIWFSKVVWMITTVMFFYLILNVVIVLFSTIMFNMSFEWSNFTNVSMLNTIQKNYSCIKFILFTMSMYILSSITMGLLQMLISFIIKPTYIYIVTILILVISLGSNKFFIPIQGSLILRQSIFNLNYPIKPLNSVIYNLTVFTIIFLVGAKFIKAFDILSSQKTD